MSTDPQVPSAAAATANRERARAWAIAGALGAALAWCYWPTILAMADRWAREPQYSHGFLVPIFAFVVLWFRKDGLANVTWNPSIVGLPLLLLGVLLRLYAGRADIEALDGYSLVPTLFGLVLLVGGWSMFWWSLPAIAFLAFMVPLPFTIELTLAHPLRRLATTMSTYALQTLGYPVVAEGNIILMDPVPLGVADACSGLGMLMTFFALATAMALIIDKPLLDRLILVASAVPIAVVVNVTRIVLTGMVYHGFGEQKIVHDLSGLVIMMPMALVLLWLELRFLNKLLVPAVPEISGPMPMMGADWRKKI